MKFLKKLWDIFITPLVGIAVMVDESRRINEDGSWDVYWKRKNKQEDDV